MIPCLRIVVLLAYCHCSLIFIAQRPEVPALDFLTGDQIQRDLDSLEALDTRNTSLPFHSLLVPGF